MKKNNYVYNLLCELSRLIQDLIFIFDISKRICCFLDVNLTDLILFDASISSNPSLFRHIEMIVFDI